ncbi:uncharacterized protein PFL1_00420 [Pseudozyma flocculosa PF-1]|uniref:Related to YFH7 - putative kinase n=1 Tax=Pseudozyma flocculosa TaxID=84751 RepID=A0A5C3EUN5_9BASI|nr:uncharacterized protein PFL1_00420 [Pseudozyma flocculosa PF-1]EPQ32223.1 hypothetical protein PFL1_00420 [Pseudozyma flocculosa PF-1]SPO34829.1 related to YFH7 - putative kinase [Pseudozyma flocculosa]
MEAKVDELSKSVLSQLEASPRDHRILIGVCGIPGSGKSSLAQRVVGTLNRLSRSSPHGANNEDDIAILIGMDGWHYTRSALSAFPDPKEAFDRRGAEFTFDSARFARFVQSLRRPGEELRAPSFDHAQKDPIEDDVVVRPCHRAVVVEGLYCNCNVGEWAKAASEFDQRWVCLIARDEARKRLVKRHVVTGVAKDEEEARWRADNNDLPNGDWLMQHLLEPYTIVESIAEPAWS